MEAFVDVWQETWGSQWLTPNELRDMAANNDLFDSVFARPSKHAQSVAFGRILQQYVDRPVGDQIVRCKTVGKRSQYWLESTVRDE